MVGWPKIGWNLLKRTSNFSSIDLYVAFEQRGFHGFWKHQLRRISLKIFFRQEKDPTLRLTPSNIWQPNNNTSFINWRSIKQTKNKLTIQYNIRSTQLYWTNRTIDKIRRNNGWKNSSMFWTFKWQSFLL